MHSGSVAGTLEKRGVEWPTPHLHKVEFCMKLNSAIVVVGACRSFLCLSVVSEEKLVASSPSCNAGKRGDPIRENNAYMDTHHKVSVVLSKKWPKW